MEAGLHANLGSDGAYDYIRWFEELSMKNLSLVGGKTASLGEMYSQLTKLGIEVPYGFAITTDAYLDFIKENKLDVIIQKLTGTQRLSKIELGAVAQNIQSHFLQSQITGKLKDEILSAYQKLKASEGSISVAVRSSATSEDLPEASFAGLHESFLNVLDEDQLLTKCLECFASLYTERAVSYRQDKNIGQTTISLSICVQVMTRSDLASSGVMFTIDTETGFKDAIVINASYGLGENIVKGVVNPDDYIVFKTTLEKGYAPILQKKIGGKEYKLIYQENSLAKGGTLQNIPTTK
ncbi:MAG: phosphoenolpyruvate synthase, partial [Alphaproteobacteria bacterium]